MTQSSPPTSSKLGPFIAVVLTVAMAAVLGYTLLSGPQPPPGTGPTTSTTAALTPEAASRPDLDLYFNTKTIGFAPLKIPTDAIQKVRAAAPTQGTAPPPEVLNPLLELYKTTNTMEAKGAEAPRRQEVARQLDIAVRELYAPYGAVGFQALIDATWPRFKKGFDHLAATSATTKRPIADLIRNPPADDPALTESIAWAGGFIPLALPMGLIDAHGALTGSPDLLPILFRYRWATALTGSLTPKALMTAPELQTLTRWRLQRSAHLPPPKRHQYTLAVLQQIPDYPAVVAKGILDYQNGQPQQARAIFQDTRAADPTLAALMTTYITQIETEAAAAKKP